MQKKIKPHILNLVTHMPKRYKIFLISIALIFLLYWILRLFFIPPILSQSNFSRAYYDRNGKLLRLTLSEDEKYRLFTPLSEISKPLQQATILYEDKYFYYHPGINFASLYRAGMNHFVHHGRQIGASTITMQVARMRYDLNTKTFNGKLGQIMCAIYIDLFHSKDEILEAYLNMAPYGGNIEGIGAASLIYFGKRANNLSTIEAITLSTIPQNPTKRALLSKTGMERIFLIRHDLVKKWIHKNPNDINLITLADMPLNVLGPGDLPFFAPHFIDRSESKMNNYWRNIGNKNSEITTTIDLGLQQSLEKKLSAEVLKRKSIGIENAAAILVNYKTMEVVAHIGSVNYFDKKIYGENDGVYAERSPGSTLKPLIYAAAVDDGYIHSMTLLKDAKINFGVYAPENSDNEFYGPVLARDALIHSRNIPAIDLLRKIGPRKFYKLLKENGVSGLKSPDHYGISVALGGAEVSMIELTDIYATMANLGMKYDIKTVLDSDKGKGHQILSPEAFFIVIDMLGKQGTTERNIPFAKKQKNTLHHYWKTGTSSSFRDAWTAGIFGDYILIVWVGNFDGTPNNSFSGAKTAAPIYFSMANSVRDYYADKNKPINDANWDISKLNISKIDMCDRVGGLAGMGCPNTVSAYFIPGKSPIEKSSVYRTIPIDKKTGKRACSFNPVTTYMDTFEFWEPEFLDMYKRAGIKRKTPPPFLPNCNLDDIIENRSKTIITSPIDKSKLVIVSNKDYEQVSFSAITDMENTKIFWFLNNNVIGTTTSGTVFQYNVPIGSHTIRAVDEMGAVTQVKFKVIR